MAGALVLAACSDGDESSVPTLELSTTTVTTAAPTTTAPPTTVEETTTTVDPRIAEVEAAVAEFYLTQTRIVLDDSVPVSELEPLVGEEFYETFSGNVLSARAEGQSADGAFTLGRLEVSLTSEITATAVGCGLDAIALLDRAGQMIVEPDLNGFVRQYELSLVSDRWRIESVVFPGSEKTTCDL